MSTGNLSLEEPKSAAKELSKGVVRIDFKGLGEGGFRFLGLFVLEEKQRLFAPGFRIVGMLGDDLIHETQGRFVLPLLVLAERRGDFLVNRLAAPFEFLAAAART